MSISICMCVYKRVYNLPKIIDALTKQTCQDFSLLVWNNNSMYGTHIHNLLNAAPFPTLIHTSPMNLGSFARFYLPPRAESQTILFIDDDQIPTPTLVEHALALPKNAIHAHHTRIFTEESYWKGAHGGYPGEEVDYCGTGGMVAPKNACIEFLSCENDLKEEFRAVEDLIFSAFARMYYNLRLYACERKVVHLIDEHDQYTKLTNVKERCFAWLRGIGWKLLRERSKLSGTNEVGRIT